MVWLLVLTVILGVIWFARKGKESDRDDSNSNSTLYVSRMGQAMVADEANRAWISGDLDRMVRAMECKTNPIDRHFLLMTIVEKAYTKRTDPEMAKLCATVADLHLSEFPAIAPVLKKEFAGRLPRVLTFQYYATLLTERGQFDKAIEVCKVALSYDLHDKTKSGFEGRIERIKKKQLQKQQA